MKLDRKLVLLVLFAASASAFVVPGRGGASTLATQLEAKNRKARRDVEKKVNRSRSKQFIEAIEEAKRKKQGDTEEEEKEKVEEPEQLSQREAYLKEAEDEIERRPEVSTLIVDEETGIEIIKQGKRVLDVVTRKAVKLSDLGPEYRLAQMFPGVPPDVRKKYRMDLKTVQVPEMIEKLQSACEVTLDDGSRGIPDHPSVANKGLDFVLANRDILGTRMRKTLIKLMMRAQWQGDIEKAKQIQELAINFGTIENHLSAPFRQMIQDAEGRVGPNFGNLELIRYCKGDLYERIANYLVLKGMVAHWETKVVDADFIEKNPQTDDNFVTVLTTGDPRRYLPNPPILYTLRECTQVCAMAQQMCQLFVENEELFAGFPPEIVFLEEAFKIRGGTALRKYMIEDFCPSRGITPEGLREGMRRLFQQFTNLQIDPYADITKKIRDLIMAMSVGTDDTIDPYTPYLQDSSDKNGPAYFETYTFDQPLNSLVRFLDERYKTSEEDKLDPSTFAEDASAPNDDIFGLSKLMGEDRDRRPLRTEPSYVEDISYTVPEERAAGRPHEAGWLDNLAGVGRKIPAFGQVPPGRIIPDE